MRTARLYGMLEGAARPRIVRTLRATPLATELAVTEPKPTATKTLRVRVRDRHARVLRAMATEVNFVWNYCAELRERVARERGQWLSGYDLQRYT